MSEPKTNINFIAFEYKDITVKRETESLLIDSYQNFGWVLEGVSAVHLASGKVTIKFKRDRKIRNKAELTRLQRQFDSYIEEIENLEKSKESKAALAAIVVGIIGTAFMAGATFAVVADHIALCIVLAVPAFIGWIIPYFLYKSVYAKRTAAVTPIIENKYDELYEVCERASNLLGNLGE